MSKQFSGETPEALPPFLGADFWEKGKTIAGVVVYDFDTDTGKAHVVELVKPVRYKGGEVRVAALGGLKGLRSALVAAGAREFVVGDKIHLECVGSVDTGQASPMLRFKVEVNRGD